MKNVSYIKWSRRSDSPKSGQFVGKFGINFPIASQWWNGPSSTTRHTCGRISTEQTRFPAGNFSLGSLKYYVVVFEEHDAAPQTVCAIDRFQLPEHNLRGMRRLKHRPKTQHRGVYASSYTFRPPQSHHTNVHHPCNMIPPLGVHHIRSLPFWSLLRLAYR